MKIQTPADRLFFVTARLHGTNGVEETAGSGFIYRVRTEDGVRDFLITNRHILEGCSKRLTLAALRANEDGPAFGQEVIGVFDDIGDGFAHPNPDVDVVALPFEQMLERMTTTGVAPFLLGVPAECAMTPRLEGELDSLEELFFVGYPNFLSDSHNGTPIGRRGITATPMSLDYEGVPAFLLDGAVFLGSSGSPVFLLRRGSAHDQLRHLAFSEPMLVGVVAKMELRKVDVEICGSDSLRGEFTDTLHLGIVFKAAAIDDCVDAALDAAGLKRASAVSKRVA